MKIIIFDIPTEKASLARRIRCHINKIQAEMIQQSVWRSSHLQITNLKGSIHSSQDKFYELNKII